MIDSLGSVAELAGTIVLGTVFGGAITRFLVNKWLKDREDFERTVVGDLKALNKSITEAREYTDHEIDMARTENLAARGVLRGHVDAENLILRDRWHAVDTLTQVWVNNIALMREELKGVVAGQAGLVEAMHELDKTISRLGQK